MRIFMKKMLKAWLSLFLAASLAVSLAGCTIPVPGFADYDVSAYILHCWTAATTIPMRI